MILHIVQKSFTFSIQHLALAKVKYAKIKLAIHNNILTCGILSLLSHVEW